MGLKNSQNHHS